jgi:hypothetical protein
MNQCGKSSLDEGWNKMQHIQEFYQLNSHITFDRNVNKEELLTIIIGIAGFKNGFQFLQLLMGAGMYAVNQELLY